MFTEWNVEHLALAVELFEDYEVMRPFLSEREEKTFLQVRSALMGEFDRRDGVAERVAEEAFPLTIRKKLDLRAGTGTHRPSAVGHGPRLLLHVEGEARPWRGAGGIS